MIDGFKVYAFNFFKRLVSDQFVTLPPGPWEELLEYTHM